MKQTLRALTTSMVIFGVSGCIASLRAQESTFTIKQDTTIVESTEKYPVVTNLFWDNWFAGAGAGMQWYYGDHNRQMELGERITPAFEFYLGKWFSPGIGVRAGLGGFKMRGVTQNHSYSTGEVYDASQGLEYQEYSFYHVHGDVLFNVSNLLAGFRQGRLYSFIPYAGLGWMKVTDEPASKEVSAGLGILNTLRLGRAVDLTLDIRGSLVNDRLDGELGGRKAEGLLATTLGLVYKFQKRGWDKPSVTTISYDEQALKNLRDRIAALEQDNEALKRQLAEAKSDKVTEVKVEDRLLAAPVLVTFPINQSVVSNEARVNLGFLAEVIKKGHKSVVYKLTGYADKGTGTPEINLRLSRERAENIYKVLVNEFGVSPAQLEVSYEGGVENMYYDDPRLSRAVITVAQ